MRRGKSQVIYKFLPDMWVAYSEENYPLSARITYWYTQKMHGIYDKFIENEIKRQIKFFGSKGGDISSYNLTRDNTLSIVELSMNGKYPDITAEISPLVFYCSSCDSVFKLNSPSQVNSSTWKCRNCGHIVVGKEAPGICPVCSHPQSYFEIKAENY